LINIGVVVISTETSNKNIDDVQETIKSVIENPDEFLTEERFNIVKQFFEIKFKKKRKINQMYLD